MALNNKHILLGVSGGIAAYKCAHLIRLFIKEGAHVKVVMTKSATEFVSPKTLSVLSKNEVTIDFFDNNNNWNNHVHLAAWADLMLIAPLTANTLAKLSTGICDNILIACYLSASCPVFTAPAMDLEMYRHPTTNANLSTLKNAGTIVIPAETGELASGLNGEGRMAEPENIIAFIKHYLTRNLPFANKSLLINAGPTYEPIDPVRFIGNRSSGKTGIAIADKFAGLGAKVTLVLGPSEQKPKHPAVKIIRVETANEMFEVCVNRFEACDIAILSAAVADYSPKQKQDQKIKKSDENLNLELVKTKDILAELGKNKKHQCLVGFALETNNAEAYAREKMKNKNLDIIIVNQTDESNAAFGSDNNKIFIIDKHNNLVNFELKSKESIAEDIAVYLKTYLGL